MSVACFRSRPAFVNCEQRLGRVRLTANEDRDRFGCLLSLKPCVRVTMRWAGCLFTPCLCVTLRWADCLLTPCVGVTLRWADCLLPLYDRSPLCAQVLCIQFKRFRWGTYTRSKVKDAVSFPVHHLDLTPYMDPRSPKARRPPVYDLYAVVIHHGSGYEERESFGGETQGGTQARRVGGEGRRAGREPGVWVGRREGSGR